jgi:hypothetical protein
MIYQSISWKAGTIIRPFVGYTAILETCGNSLVLPWR